MGAIFFGETIRVDIIWYDFDGSVADPDSQTIDLYTPSGGESGTTRTTPTYVEKGMYYQKLTIPSAGPAGTWRIRWTGTAGSDVGVSEKKIEVVAP